MTTATATTEGQEDLTGTETGEVDQDTRVPTDDILTGQEGAEAMDAAEVEAAMAAGWKKAGPEARRDDEVEEDITDVVAKKVTSQPENTVDNADGEGDDATQEATSTTTQPDDDPEVPGTGMKASEVRAMREQLQVMQKSLASTSGHLGHLKQLVQQAGQGKKVTAESLKRVSEEFGVDFAAAMADDLNEAGFGGGVPVDTAAIEQMVESKVAAAREASQREFEKKLVLRAHPDADDHFARPKLGADGQPVMQKDKDGTEHPVWEPGPKHAAFIGFVQTLPKERQEQLFGAGGWDSSIVTRALDEFKEHEKKAANTQATQQQRINRAVVPKTGSGRDVQQPAGDPMAQGWNNVRGRRAAGPSSAGRGR